MVLNNKYRYYFSKKHLIIFINITMAFLISPEPFFIKRIYLSAQQSLLYSQICHR